MTVLAKEARTAPALIDDSLEPPRRSLRVDLVMWFAERAGRAGVETPHCCGGDLQDRVQYECLQGTSFFDAFGGAFGLDDLEGKDVLDLGCGWGGKAILYAQQAWPKSMTGIDLPGFDPEVPARHAMELGVQGLTFVRGHAEELPFDGDSFDVVLCEDVLEHVRDPRKVLAEVLRVLRPGGLFLSATPSFKSIYGHHLDRAVFLPGLHYLAPLRVWAAGLNQRLQASEGRLTYQPFGKVVDTGFALGVTPDLNGMDRRQFEGLVRSSGFQVERFSLVPFRRATGVRLSARKAVYEAAWKTGLAGELLSKSMVFVGRKAR